MSEGYIMVKYTGSVGKIKVQITKSGSETYTYDLSSSGVYEVFPLSEGSGSYSVKAVSYTHLPLRPLPYRFIPCAISLTC